MRYAGRNSSPYEEWSQSPEQQLLPWANAELAIVSGRGLPEHVSAVPPPRVGTVPLHGHRPDSYDPKRVSGETLDINGKSVPIEQFLSVHCEVINYVLSRQVRPTDYQYLDRNWLLGILVRCAAIGAGLTADRLIRMPYVYRDIWQTKHVFHLWAIGSKLAHAAKEARMLARNHKRSDEEILRLNLRAVDDLARLEAGTAHNWNG